MYIYVWPSGTDPEQRVGVGLLILNRGDFELYGPNSKKGVFHIIFFHLDAIRRHLL